MSPGIVACPPDAAEQIWAARPSSLCMPQVGAAVQAAFCFSM
jgi:hypothetical protein